MTAEWDHLIFSWFHPHPLHYCCLNPTTLALSTINSHPLNLQLSTFPILTILLFHPLTPHFLWSHHIAAQFSTLQPLGSLVHIYFQEMTSVWGSEVRVYSRYIQDGEKLKLRGWAFWGSEGENLWYRSKLVFWLVSRLVNTGEASVGRWDGETTKRMIPQGGPSWPP